MIGISAEHSIPSCSKNLNVNIFPKHSTRNGEKEEQNIPSFSSLQRKTSAVSLCLSPPATFNDSSKHRRLSSNSSCADSLLNKKPSFDIGLSSSYSSSNQLFAPSPSFSHRHSTGDLRSPSNIDSEEEESSDNSSSLRPKRKYAPSFFSGSFWSIFPGPPEPSITSISKAQKKSESLADVSKLSNCFEHRIGSRRNSTLTLNTHPKRSRSSLPSEITPHPWGITMKHEDGDSSDDSRHTIIMHDRDSGIVVPKTEPLPSPRLATPRPIRMRSRSPRLGTIESVDCLDEERSHTLAARRNSSLSTVLEAPTPSVEDSLNQDKAILPYNRRRMSAFVTSNINPLKSNPTYIGDDDQDEDSG